MNACLNLYDIFLPHSCCHHICAWMVSIHSFKWQMIQVFFLGFFSPVTLYTRIIHFNWWILSSPRLVCLCIYYVFKQSSKLILQIYREWMAYNKVHWVPSWVSHFSLWSKKIFFFFFSKYFDSNIGIFFLILATYQKKNHSSMIDFFSPSSPSSPSIVQIFSGSPMHMYITISMYKFYRCFWTSFSVDAYFIGWEFHSFVVEKCKFFSFFVLIYWRCVLVNFSFFLFYFKFHLSVTKNRAIHSTTHGFYSTLEHTKWRRTNHAFLSNY